MNKTNKKIDAILSLMSLMEKQRQILKNRLEDTLPFKVGEKVSIINIETKKHIRFSFIGSIDVRYLGKERKANVFYILKNCKRDGTMAHSTVYLFANETIKKV